MAFKKSTIQSGYTFEYWSIISLQSRKIENTSRVTIAVYKNNETRKSNIGSYVKAVTVDIPYAYSIEDAYKKLKESHTPIDVGDSETPTAFFADAVDC